MITSFNFFPSTKLAIITSEHPNFFCGINQVNTSFQNILSKQQKAPPPPSPLKKCSRTSKLSQNVRKYFNLCQNGKGTTVNKGCVAPWPQPFTLEKWILRQKKEELWELKYFTMQKYNLPKKNPLKETQKKNPSRYQNSRTNLKFQHKPGKRSSFKNPHIKIDLLLLLFIIIIIIYYLGAYKNPLSYYILYNESKHKILALVGKANKRTEQVGCCQEGLLLVEGWLLGPIYRPKCIR